MKVAIVGSRGFPHPKLVESYVRSLALNDIVVSGGAPGVDRIALAAADARGLITVSYEADWEGLGKGAGMIRNSLIVAQADIVVAFWDGESRGTRDTMRKAHNVDKLKRVVVCLHGGAPLVYDTPAALTAVIGA